MRILDLSVPLDMYTHLGSVKIEDLSFSLKSTKARDGVTLTRIRLMTHTGTHVDAPMHVFERHEKPNGVFSVDEYPLEQLIGMAAVLDVPKGPLEEITAADLEAAGMEVGEGDIVLLHTGWGRYFSDDPRNDAYIWNRRPGLVPDAAAWLVGKGIKALGLDLPATQHPRYSFRPTREARESTGDPVGYEPVHDQLLGHDVAIVEGLRNLDKIAGRRIMVSFFPLPFRGVDGAPARAVAYLDATPS